MISYFTNKLQNLIGGFQVLFGHPIKKKPDVPMDIERATVRMIWTAEECIEYIAASASSREEFSKYYYQFEQGMKAAYQKILDADDFNLTDEERIIAQADALGDQIYFVFGTACENGIDLEPIVVIIDDANKSKLFIDENGRKYAKYREDGKVLKSEHYYKPEPFIKEEIQKQLA